ncbi:MAG: CPBP family intramembrane glutamic endopeptidase, partial [Spirochaetia bacterium]
AALIANILFDIYAPRILPSARRMFRAMEDALGGIGYCGAAILAASSALGEEMFFRGAVQPSLGILAASLLFALSHFPIRKELLLWPFYALIMGLILGTLRNLGGDIWSAVLLHFLVNFFGLVFIGKGALRGN